MLDEACLFIEGSQLCRQDFALQQDNAPIHTAWATTEYFHAMGINILHKWNWTNHKWNVEYCESACRLHAFVPWTGARPVGMGLPQVAFGLSSTACRLVLHGRSHLSMHKWGLAPSPNCKCGASEQTTDHVLTACLIHWAPHGARGLMVLDDKTRCWLNNTTASI